MILLYFDNNLNLDLFYLTCLTSSVFFVNEFRKLIVRILLKRHTNRQHMTLNQWMV